MKNILSRFGKISLLLALIYFVVGCDDDKEDVAPGLYVMSDEIETFPGDTVLVSGTASNYVGLESVTLSCEQWGIHKVYELGGQKPKVFNYDYRLIVPKNASFEEYLLITIRDVDGRESKKNVLLTYVADMESPIMQTQLPSRIAVDFDAAANKGSWSLNVKFTDDRELKDIRLQIPSMQIDETVKVTGRNGELKRTIDFTTGEFPVTLTITDAGGNETVVITTVVVMLAEKEEPFEDYPVMWVVNASEKADDYLDGYYAPMTRKGEYQYEGKIYADKANFQIYFTAEKTMDGDLFGVSPYVNSKLMNNNDYVVPVTVAESGYYGVWIDLQAHTYSMWKRNLQRQPIQDRSPCPAVASVILPIGVRLLQRWRAMDIVIPLPCTKSAVIQVRANTMQPVCPTGDMFSAIGAMRPDAAGGKILQAQVAVWQAMQATMTVQCKSPSIQLFFGLQSRK